MDTALVITVIGSIQTLAVAVIGGLFARDSKKRKLQLDDVATRALLRAEESRLSMKLLSADVSLTMATARAVKEGRANGKMDAALALAEVAEAEYYAFVNAVAAKQLTK
jgi:hypothetical protein